MFGVEISDNGITEFTLKVCKTLVVGLNKSVGDGVEGFHAVAGSACGAPVYGAEDAVLINRL